jgi:hypothetical protein
LSEERDQPVAEEGVTPESVEGVADEASAQGDDQTPELDEDGNPIEAADDDTEEIEYEGKTFKGPKGLRDAILRQADYTRKTQEVAEQRKALEARHAETAQQAEARARTFEQRVQLAQIDSALEQYNGLDWATYVAQYGEGAAITAQAQWRQLESAKAGLQREITDKEAEFVRSSEQVTANALREAHEVLSREVQGYGNELVSKVAQEAQKWGFTGEEIRHSFVGDDGKADVRTFKALARLATLEAENAALKSKQTKTQTAQKQAAVQPARTVSANAGQYKAGLDDNLPHAEWLRRREAEVAKARGR